MRPGMVRSITEEDYDMKFEVEALATPSTDHTDLSRDGMSAVRDALYDLADDTLGATDRVHVEVDYADVFVIEEPSATYTAVVVTDGAVVDRDFAEWLEQSDFVPYGEFIAADRDWEVDTEIHHR